MPFSLEWCVSCRRMHRQMSTIHIERIGRLFLQLHANVCSIECKAICRHMFVRDKVLRFSCLLLRSIFYIPGRKNGIINLKGNQQLLILLSIVDSTTRILSITNTHTLTHTKNTQKWDKTKKNLSNEPCFGFGYLKQVVWFAY